MTTLTDQLSRAGVDVNAEFDESVDENSLHNIATIIELPIWERKWSHKLMLFSSQDLSVDEYIEGTDCIKTCFSCINCLSCNLMCRKYDKSSVTSKEKESKIAPFDAKSPTELGTLHDAPQFVAARNGPDAKQTKDDTLKRPEDQDLVDQIGELAFNWSLILHYCLHLTYRVPMFYINMSLLSLSAVVFRMGRSGILSCLRCAYRPGCNCGPILRLIVMTLANSIITPILVVFGFIMYWADIIVNKMVFTPVLALALTTKYAFKGSLFEPMSLTSSTRYKVEEMFRDWAWAADQLVNDPDGEAGDSRTQIRSSMVSITNVVRGLSVFCTTAESRGYAQIAGPFFIQVVLMYIVYLNIEWNPVIDFSNTQDQIRVVASAAAFVYYVSKAAASVNSFIHIGKGHTSIVFLLVDFGASVAFVYIIIPMAVWVVLTSEGLDIVLNLLALEFVTMIDEELFESRALQQYSGPYIIVFKVRVIGGRKTCGLCDCSSEPNAAQSSNEQDSTPGDLKASLVLDVYSKHETKTVAKDGSIRITSFWLRNPSISGSSYELLRYDQSTMDSLNLQFKANWNIHTTAKSDRKRSSTGLKIQEVDDRKEEKVENNRGIDGDDNRPYLILTGVKKTLSNQVVQKCLQQHIAGAGLSHLVGRCTSVESFSYGQRSAYFEKPQGISPAFFNLDVTQKAKFKIQLDSGKTHPVGVHPVIPCKADSDDPLLSAHEFFEASLIRNLPPNQTFDAKASAFVQAHLKILGGKRESSDSRLMIVYDFPFADEDHLWQ